MNLHRLVPRFQLSLALGLLTVWLAACGTLRAADPPAAEALLTVGRLFGTKEFDTDKLPERRWSKRSATYFTLDKSSTGTGSELVRNDPATGKKEVIRSKFSPKP